MPYPTSTSASDVWSLKSLYVAIAGDNWPSIAQPDPNFNQVSLLLNGDGTDGGQNNTFSDSSVNDLTLSATSDITQGSFNPFGDNWSTLFDSSSHLEVTHTSSLSFTGDFTIEFWSYVTGHSDTYPCFISNYSTYTSNGGFALFVDHGNGGSNLIELSLNGSFPAIATNTSSYAENSWHHFALVRSGSTVTLYIDGQSEGTTTFSGTLAGTENFWWINAAGDSETNSQINGNISNLRAVSSAVYTANFTPPTEPLTAISGTELLTCQSYGFKDASTNDYALTVNGTPKVTKFSPFSPAASYDATSLGGSAYFPNTTTASSGHQFSTPATADLDIGSGDFTIECFYYPTSIQNYSRVLWFNETWSNINAAGFAYGSPSGGKLNFVANGIANPMVSTNNDMELFCWYHIAVTRTGNEFAMYVDGVKQTSTYTSSSEIFPTSTPTLYVGNGPTSVGGYSPLQGYVANARVVKGTAVYSTDFTPPTSPVTAVSGTAALINFADAAIPDYSTINNVNTVGNADISTAVVKYGTGSLAFDGTGDYLETLNGQALGNGDFTIEGWVNFNEVSQDSFVSTRDATGGSSTGMLIAAYSSLLQVYTAGGFQLTSTTTLSTGTWYYVAIVKSSGTTTLYLDGIAEDTYADSNNYTSTRIYVGNDVSLVYPLNGYIDDFRITKGLARYTSTFTPPTAALPTF